MNQAIWYELIMKQLWKQSTNRMLKPCPAKPSPTTTYIPSPTSSTRATSRPKTCECPLVNCLAIWPGGCYCQNTAAQNCYDRCGGEPPKLQNCDIDQSLPQPTNETEPTCECEGVMCIQMWPESCYCANAAAQACHAKCGGPKPNLQVKDTTSHRTCYYLSD